MDLDTKTMFTVTITVAAVLGFLLIYAWQQHRQMTALAWWGGAHLVACAAVWMIGSHAVSSAFWSVEIANALLFLSAGMIWNGARLFDGNRTSLVGVFGGAVAWILSVQVSGFMSQPHLPVIFSSMIIAAYTFATAIEFWRNRGENLLSRVPLIVLLSTHGALYLLRVPFALVTPGSIADFFLSPVWFSVIGLESLLYMIATAFILLAMAKERTELEHKVAATTDPLTGIANRRAFLEGAQRSLQQRSRVPQPVSVLLFDLDRFKSINDRYGHAAGDRVLRAFADVAVIELRSTDLLGRLGGEEFGAILFGAEASSAAATAERIRAVFAAGFVGESGANDEISVSVGVASVPAGEKTEIEVLMQRADEALYVAKARGRNRVEVADGYAHRSGGRDIAEPVGAPVKQSLVGAPGTATSPGLVPTQSGFGELAVSAGAVRQRT